MRIIQDTPLEEISQDKFGRESMVELIVDSINSIVSTKHHCMVYGIYGKWGEGKTSLMNFVKNRFIAQGKKDGIIIVEFNPWLVNNDEALLREFFKTLMTDTKSLLRKAFKKYGSLAIFASKRIINAVKPGVGAILAKGLQWAKDAINDTEDTLSELKKKASETIVESGKHLVIMIDDVDRLDNEELHAVLRLIRQVADFDNCIYIVAMDADMVSKSIGKYHGGGSKMDGRKFLDKIVQVPITLPKVPMSDMSRIVAEEISRVLDGYAGRKTTDEIIDETVTFFRTYRELKRYCNQLLFVLPHLKDEVNVKDLCILEAIKTLSGGAYERIYERQSQLRREMDPVEYHIMGDNNANAKIDEDFEKACDYVAEELTGVEKETVRKAVSSLFHSNAVDYQTDLDEKHIFTDTYFKKYYALAVPSDLLPDRVIESLMPKVSKGDVQGVNTQMDEWLELYPASEIKRAALYIIRKSPNGDERCHAASIIAKAFTECKLAKGLPPNIYVDSKAVASFVPYQIIYKYMFVRDEQYAAITVRDESVLDETLAFIFEKGEMNYCMNVFCSSDFIFLSGSYSGIKVLPILIRRFKDLTFEQQFIYSKFLLVTFFNAWKRVDDESFSEYARDLFSNPDIPCQKVFDRFIDGTDDELDVVNFVKLFMMQISIINERLQKENEDVQNSHSVKTYALNYKRHLIE